MPTVIPGMEVEALSGDHALDVGDGRTAGIVGMPTCSMNTSWVAAVPPCMPSTTTTSAPAFTASCTS